MLIAIVYSYFLLFHSFVILILFIFFVGSPAITYATIRRTFSWEDISLLTLSSVVDRSNFVPITNKYSYTIALLMELHLYLLLLTRNVFISIVVFVIWNIMARIRNIGFRKSHSLELWPVISQNFDLWIATRMKFFICCVCIYWYIIYLIKYSYLHFKI